MVVVGGQEYWLLDRFARVNSRMSPLHGITLAACWRQHFWAVLFPESPQDYFVPQPNATARGAFRRSVAQAIAVLRNAYACRVPMFRWAQMTRE
jgi:hypothetical protein